MKKVPCPKCGRPLERAGTVTTAEGSSSVYQCDECEDEMHLDGETFTAALTFAVDGAGQVFSPFSF